ncbi:MAG TPA: metallophosphoesterase family protein [Abditibacteriaceae bacterium]|nr:metallophosphoesterase family protein [Abditibacteriaceae bacterium]
MRTLAIGDIHGCSHALDLLLAAIELQPDDLLITLGDYVDRGPDSKGVLERIIALQSTHRVVPLRGNHEIMMLAARANFVHALQWMQVGGLEALNSYASPGTDATLEDVPAEHWKFIAEICVPYYETETHFFVHANAYADIDLAEQPEYMLYWQRFDRPSPHISGKIMICGHTSQKKGVPLNYGHAICIDTWAYGRGWLTCLDVTSGQVWQTNQAGKQRQAHIDDFLK